MSGIVARHTITITVTMYYFTREKDDGTVLYKTKRKW